MANCVKLLTNPVIAVEDGLTVSLPDICTRFERPLECPEVETTTSSWFINGFSVRLYVTTDLLTQKWVRMRDTVEDGSTFGPWSDWFESQLYPTFTTIDALYPTLPENFGQTVPYNWYDLQILLQPAGTEYIGYTEISPLCGGWWHFQTPSKNDPPVDPPDPENPPIS